jgi:hypothetical protein
LTTKIVVLEYTATPYILLGEHYVIGTPGRPSKTNAIVIEAKENAG